MGTNLVIATQERPQRAVARREAADPLAAILAGQLSEHTGAPIDTTWDICWRSWSGVRPSLGAG